MVTPRKRKDEVSNASFEQSSQSRSGVVSDEDDQVGTSVGLPMQQIIFGLVAVIVTLYFKPYEAVLQHKVNMPALLIAVLLTGTYSAIFAYLYRLSSKLRIKFDYKDLSVYAPNYIEVATACLFGSWIFAIYAFTQHYGLLLSTFIMGAEFFGFVAVASLII
ncbi:hypothetical protein MIR68_005862 [Amoeboaphelidium protococcarum]|nr:hypothetical protein MIR68_005862 [Amoeboaphelidium protococcarum]